MQATDMLTREHGLIVQILDSLFLAQKKIESGQRPPAEFFEKAVAFLRDFADRFHHFKEEYLMFGLLAEKKAGAYDDAIAALRYQHDRGRYFVNEIAHCLPEYAEGDAIATSRLLENLAAHIALLRRHIYEEDHIFFPMTARELSEDDDRALVVQFEKEEARPGGKDFFEKNRRLAAEMQNLIAG